MLVRAGCAGGSPEASHRRLHHVRRRLREPDAGRADPEALRVSRHVLRQQRVAQRRQSPDLCAGTRPRRRGQRDRRSHERSHEPDLRRCRRRHPAGLQRPRRADPDHRAGAALVRLPVRRVQPDDGAARRALWLFVCPHCRRAHLSTLRARRITHAGPPLSRTDVVFVRGEHAYRRRQTCDSAGRAARRRMGATRLPRGVQSLLGDGCSPERTALPAGLDLRAPVSRLRRAHGGGSRRRTDAACRARAGSPRPLRAGGECPARAARRGSRSRPGRGRRRSGHAGSDSLLAARRLRREPRHVDSTAGGDPRIHGGDHRRERV